MEILYNLLNAIVKFRILKTERVEEKVRRIDVLDYALILVNYILEFEDSIDNETLFMSKFAIDYLNNNPLIELASESDEEKNQCREKIIELQEKAKEIDYASRINSFDEFIASLYFPLVATGKNTPEVIPRKGFYETADDLYRMMRLAVARPNDKLLRYYNQHYKGIKLEYIKIIAKIVTEEFSRYKIDLDEADKQFMDLCYMINKYLKQPVLKSIYYDTASRYVDSSMDIMLRKIKVNK